MALIDHVPDTARPWIPPGAHVEDVRLRLAQRAAKDTYFMAKAVLRMRDITKGTHGPMARFIRAESHKRKVGLAPRDHLKTSIWTIADSVSRIADNPNIRILLGNATATNASHFLRRIEAVFDRNAFFKWLYPELCDTSERSVWNQTEMMVPRSEDYPEATVEVIGVGGEVVSRHYNLIKLDDLVAKEASESEEVMRKTIDWYDYCESLLDHPELSELQNYGTRWGFHDVHSHAEAHEINPLKFFASALILDPAAPEGWRAFWPERFSVKTLLAIKKKIGSFKFQCQYQNDPKDPDATTFDEKWLRFYKLAGTMCIPDRSCPDQRPVDWRTINRIITVDPAISEDDLACNTAIICSGQDSFERKWILETFAKRMDPGETIQNIIRIWFKWDCPDTVGIESVAYQKALSFFLKQEMNRRGIYFRIIEIKRGDRKSKKSRIRGLMPFYERGEIYQREDMHQLNEEYRQFPTGKLMDCLDALADGPSMWEGPEDESASDDEDVESFERAQLGRCASTGY